jgi:molybdate transport system regulatory protein
MAKRTLRARLELEAGVGAKLSDARIRLLEAIDQSGSITKAARQVTMSYKTAWDTLDTLDNLADEPVIERSVGGAGGGGTRLTPYGRWLIAMFRAVEGEYQGAVDALATSAGPELTDPVAFKRLLRRLMLRSSVRNQFVCTVSHMSGGPVMQQVFLAFDTDYEIVAHIPTESVKDLALVEGQEVIALVTAPAVVLLGDSRLRTSVQNHLTGVVSRIVVGPITAEVVIDLPPKSGRHLTSVVPAEAVAALGLKVGSPTAAVFQPSSLFLVTPGP